MSTDTKKRFRVAFSLAGEKKDFVGEVALGLAEHFGEAAILFYKFHEAEFSRDDLGIYLPQLYHTESDLVVVVVCPDYDEKEWTGLEWTAIHDLLKRRKHEEVMLFRFERAQVKGLYSTAGFVDLDEKTPSQAATLILERLALNEGKPKDYYTTQPATTIEPARTSTPNNLPRLQTFFGRTEELKQIADALDEDSRTWGALIDGPGGMGKTSLAVRAAYDCPPGQFDRIIFLSVKDRELDDDGERQLGAFILPGFLEMLNELARELGKAELTKSAESERIRLILEALRSTRTLLILDNLESLTKGDRDQLFTFVKRLPQGCKAILTSRRRIGTSADVLILSDLDETAALQTLADLAEHNPLLAKTTVSERRSLHKQTGGNPLLLRWTAGQLGLGSCRTIHDALKFLRSCPPGNDALEFVFGDLARGFTDDETRVLVALSYFTLPTKVEHIATVAALSSQSTESALRTLANRSLVAPDQEERAFSHLPMVGDFIRHERPEMFADTGDRLEQRAYALVVENGYDKHDRFKILDAEWPTITPALPLFIAGPNQRLQTACDALRFFFEFTLRWDEWLSLEQQAEKRAIEVGDYVSAGWRAYGAGWVHYLRGQTEQLLTCANRMASHCDSADANPFQRLAALQLRGIGHEAEKDYPAAIAVYREVIELGRSLPPQTEVSVHGLSDLADAELAVGDIGAAEQHYRQALAKARAGNYSKGVATVAGNLAELLMHKKEWRKAEKFARQALTISEAIGRLELIAIQSHVLAEALRRQGKHQEALPHARRAVTILEQHQGAKRQDLEEARHTLAACEAANAPTDKKTDADAN